MDPLEYYFGWPGEGYGDSDVDVDVHRIVDQSENNYECSDADEEYDFEDVASDEIVNLPENSSNCSAADKHSDESLDEVFSLQEICLITIVENFDRFCGAFKMPDCKVPKRNWEFLARRFSEPIFRALKQSIWEIKSEHLDFLINPYMKKLNIEGLGEEILPDLIERLKEHGGGILTFEADSRDLCDNFSSPLMSTLTNVETICYTWDLYECMHDSTYFPEKTNAQIPPICEAIGKYCTSLKNLEFHFYGTFNVEAWNHGIAFILKRCPCLETLQYPYTVEALYMLYKNDLPSLANNENTSSVTGTKHVLKSLSLNRGNYPSGDALEICAVTCPRVSSLHVNYLITAEEVEKISRFVHLENLHFQESVDMRIPSNCLTNVFSLIGTNLLSLSMTCVPGLSTETLIESCPKLQSLILRRVDHLQLRDGAGLSHDANLADLLKLELSYSDFTMPNAAASAKLIILAAKSLKQLSVFSSNGLTNEFVGSLNLFTISMLDVSFSDIKLHPLMAMMSRGNLEELVLLYCGELTYSDYLELTSCASSTQRKVKIMYHK